MTFTATDPNGQTHIINSKSRAYSHAVVAVGHREWKNTDYYVIGWCGSLQLAEKLAASKRRYYSNVAIVNAA